MTIPGLEPITLIRVVEERDPETGRTVTFEKRSTVYFAVQAPSGDEMEIMEGGHRSEDVRRLFGFTPLRGYNVRTQTAADRVSFEDEYGSDEWRVSRVRPWRLVNSHYEVFVVREKEPEDS